MPNRLVVAQGPIQLVQAIAVLRTLSQSSPSEGGDALLFGGFGVEGADKEAMLSVCRRIASTWNFSRIEDAPADRMGCSPAEWAHETALLAERFAKERPGQILVCRNSHFVNEVALGAFPNAERIAYGDSLGVADTLPAGTPSRFNPAGILGTHANYAVFPSLRQSGAWNDSPPRLIATSVLADLLAECAALLPELDAIAARLDAELGQNPTLALTSYLTEAHQLPDPANEIAALAETILQSTLVGERIAVKGHPRERHGQSQRVAQILSQAGRKVVLLDEFRQIPIELLLQKWKPGKAFAFVSSSSIPLAWIAGCELYVGFGRRALSRMYSGAQLAERMVTEQSLALQARNAFLGEVMHVSRWDRGIPGQFNHLPIRLTKEQARSAKSHGFPDRMVLDEQNPSTASRVRRLHLGSGVKRMLGYLDVDAFVAARGILPVSHVELPHQTASVDEILSEHSLEHIGKYEVPRALAEWSRVLRPGGRLLMNLPNLEWCMKAWLAAPEEVRWGWQLDTIFGLQDHPGEYHKTGFTAPRLFQLLSEAGFSDIRISDFWSHGQGCFWVEAVRDDALRESPEGRAALSPGFEVLERAGFGPTEAVGGASLIGTDASFKIPVGSGTDLLRLRFDIALPHEYKGAEQVLEIQTGNGKSQTVTLTEKAPRLTASLEIPSPKGDVAVRLRCLKPGADVEGVEVGVLVGNLRFLASRDAKGPEDATTSLPASLDEALEKALAIHVAGEPAVARRRISQIATSAQGVQLERALILLQLRGPEAVLWELEGLDDSPGVRQMRAAAWIAMGELARADALLAKGDWSTLAGKDTVARLAARRAAREGRWDDVRIQMESIDPDGRSSLDVLFMAACQLLSGRREESLQTAEHLFHGDCDDDVLRGWIETLLACKETQAATRWLERAVATNPAQWFEWAVRLRALGLAAPPRAAAVPSSTISVTPPVAQDRQNPSNPADAVEAVEAADQARSRGDLESERRFLSQARSLAAPSSPLGMVLQARESIDKIRSNPRQAIPSDPLVSIVIPVHNGKVLTTTCLECLDKVGASVRHEIVVVDDASNDGTLEELKALESKGRIRLVVHEANQGFARSCNDGAKASRGDILVFLNNDTLPLPGWLQVLVDELRKDPTVGAAGSKLLYPDGTIQHAGMVWERPDRPNPEHVFRKLRGESPEVTVTLDYPAVTGACFAVPTSLFREMDGFSLEFGMYSEDVDFCLRLWERGHRVRYCAHSRVIHLESATPMDNEIRAERVRLAADRLRKSWHDRWPAAFASMPNWMWPQQVRTAKPVSTPSSHRPRIGFDGRTFSVADSVVRGIGHYTIHHLQAILAERPDADVTVLYFDGFPPLDDIRLPIEALGGKWASWSSCQASDFDLFHTPDPMYVHPQFCNPFQRYGSTRTTSTFYDLIPLRLYPGQVGNWPGYLARLDAVKHSGAKLLCISEYTRKDLLEATGIEPSRAVTVMAGFIGSGATTEPTEFEARELMSRLGIHGSFFLHVGATDPHKNFEAAINATIPLAQRRGCQLVVVGKLSNALSNARDQILKAGLRHVVFTDFLSRRDLEILYSRAVATLFLSRYEGFGLPPLEAMAAGCPVVCSNVTSLPEVVGDAALTHAPDDLAGIAATLERLVTDSVLRQELSERGRVRSRMFRWEDVAKKTWQVWDGMLALPAPVAQPAPEKAKVRWISPIWDPSGYADESRAFVKHLAGTDLGLSLMGTGRHSETFRQAAPYAERRLIDDLMGRESQDECVAVLDMPASGLGRFPGAGFHVGRTTFETDSLPAEWAARCNGLDEIWVPCLFNLETFRKAGVTKPILVVPEGVDTDKFRPGLEPLEIPGPKRGTTFLAVFEWTLRKSPDFLIVAWAKAFCATDDVRLVIRAYPANHIEGDPVAWVEEQIDTLLTRSGGSRAQCAPIVVIGKQIPDADMPRLYAAADVYVAPSRGEGWGRPHMEAMSTGVPVIATNWGGNLDFQNNDNSWLIDIDGLEEIDAREEFAFYRGQRWARPSVSHLCWLLKTAASDPDRRRALGDKARRDMVEKWDWRKIAPLAEIRLREILDGVSADRSRLLEAETRDVSTKNVEIAAPSVQSLLPKLKGRIPIAMPAYNRDTYLRQVLSALKENTHRDRFYIATGEEPGCPETKALFDAVDWMPVVRTVNRERLGCNANVTSTIDRAFELNDRAVILEDDIVPSSDFLAWNLWGLERFARDPGVFSIGSYRMNRNPRPVEDLGGGTLAGWFTPWGWSSWRDRWNRFRREAVIPANAKDSWDFFLVKWMTEIAGLLELRPLVGRSQNIGEVGTFVPNAQWHRDNHRTPYWFPDAGHPPLEPQEFFLQGERGLDRASLEKIPVRWCGQLFNYSGYARLGREAVAGLMDLGTPLTADPLLNDKNWFMGLKPGTGMDRWRTLLSRPPEPGVLVSCDIPRDASGRNELFEQIAQANPGCPARVGWTMFETDRLPKGWAQSLDKLDEVWVPSEFNRKTFSVAGVDPSKLHVIPGSIDPGPYLGAEPLELPGKKATVTYLSVFQWVRRKGWDVLLKAWAMAFRPTEDVRLVLRCHPFGDTGLSMRDIFRRSLSELGLREEDMAPILLLEDFVAESDIPRLYAACDIFVLPSRGEGWGLPYLEAMASAKPCIATAWGASLEFLNEDNSWLIDPRTPVRVGEAACAENPYLDPDHLWADPDPVKVAEILRLTATTKDEYIAKANRSRSDAIAKWNPRTTAAAIGRRLLALQAKTSGHSSNDATVPAVEHVGGGRLSDAIAKVASGLKESRSSSRHASPPIEESGFPIASGRHHAQPRTPGRKLSIRWEGSQFIHHSLAHVNRELCLGLSRLGHELSLIPFEPDQFDPATDPRLAPLAKLVDAPLDHACDIHLRHQWPPNLQAPAEGKWVVVQPWEFGSPPKEWIPAFSTQVDELWAYTEHVRRMYLEAGVPSEIVKVVPLGVDCDNFRPGLAPMALSTRKSFKFLFVGGTIARKGFDVLLNAWNEAFGPEDDVCLVVKDIGGKSFYKGQTGADWIREMQVSGKCAEIEYLDTELQPSQLPSLYAACDVLVHPYRGEGFGLPIAEAMACGLPCVVTRGGAADDFCTESESWGVQARRVPVPGGKVGPFETVAAPWWLEPSVPDLVDKLRQAFRDTAARARKGAAARGRIALHFTWEKAAGIAQERLRALADKPVRRQRPTTVGGSSFSKLAAKTEMVTESVKPNLDLSAEASPQLEELNRLLFKAEAAAARGDIPEADRLTEEAADKHPDQHLAWLARAMVLRGLGKYRKAIDAIERCTKLNPVPDALLEAFQIHLLAGEPGPAKRIEKILKEKHAEWLKSAREDFRARGQAWPLDAAKVAKSVAKSPAPPRKGKH